MHKENRIKRVVFVDEKLHKAYLDLEKGRSEEKELALFLKRAIDDLRENPACGNKIPRAVWPREYVQKYGIDNLWNYYLPDGWRLVYTLKGNELEIISIILEWFNHKEYEKRFGYKSG